MDARGKMIGQGNTAQIYDYGTDCIIKLYREGLPEQLCRDEFYKTRLAYQLTASVPEPMEIVRVDGRIGAVYKKLHGKTMLRELLAKPWRSGYYAKCLALYHVQLQKPVDDDLPTVKEKLKRDIAKVSVLSENEKQAIYHTLEALPDGNTLCHFDYHPDNILLYAGQYSVIDWMTACKGDKMADVARTGIILKFGQIPRTPAIVNFFVGAFQKYLYKKYIASYLSLTKESIGNIAKWEPAVAAARLCEWIPEKEKQNLLSFVKGRIRQGTPYS